jgi:hypothetical protein
LLTPPPPLKIEKTELYISQVYITQLHTYTWQIFVIFVLKKLTIVPENL